ncbi:hypothetical protein SALBM311S_10254 [Streptomyces alboniger]
MTRGGQQTQTTGKPQPQDPGVSSGARRARVGRWRGSSHRTGLTDAIRQVHKMTYGRYDRKVSCVAGCPT